MKIRVLGCFLSFPDQAFRFAPVQCTALAAPLAHSVGAGGVPPRLGPVS